MKPFPLPSLSLWALLLSAPCHGQNAFSNLSSFWGGSDNTGGSTSQAGTEVLKSVPGTGVSFAPGTTFEHVGQFYVAQDGLWNAGADQGNTPTIDYFGYAPKGQGAYLAYQGVGIQGASSRNGGSGAGRPTFGVVEVNSTGDFPLTAGMYVTHTLAFNAHGPAKSSVISTPKALDASTAANTVELASGATITGANQANYINGYASVQDARAGFYLPLGDAAAGQKPLHAITLNQSVAGRLTARYLHQVQPAITALSSDVRWVSPVGSWPISAPAGTSLTVQLPSLTLSEAELAELHLVGWNGKAWVNLSEGATLERSIAQGYQLSGTLVADTQVIGIGLPRQSRPERDAVSLSLWPNPTPSHLSVRLSAGKAIKTLRITNAQGRALLQPKTVTTELDVSFLSAGSYVVEVETTQGQTLSQRFIKQ